MAAREERRESQKQPRDRRTVVRAADSGGRGFVGALICGAVRSLQQPSSPEARRG